MEAAPFCERCGHLAEYAGKDELVLPRVALPAPAGRGCAQGGAVCRVER